MTFRGGFEHPVETSLGGSKLPEDTNMDGSKLPADRNPGGFGAKTRHLMGIMRSGGAVDVTKYPNPYGVVASKPSLASLSGTSKPRSPKVLPVFDDGADVTVTHSTASFDASRSQGAAPAKMSANADPGHSGDPKARRGSNDQTDVTRSSKPYGSFDSKPSRPNAADPRKANDRPGADHAADVSLIVNVGAAPSYTWSVEPGAAAVIARAAAGPGDSGSPKGRRNFDDGPDVTAIPGFLAFQRLDASKTPTIWPGRAPPGTDSQNPKGRRSPKALTGQGAAPAEWSANATASHSGDPKARRGSNDQADVTRSSNPYGAINAGRSRLLAAGPWKPNNGPGLDDQPDVTASLNFHAPQSSLASSNLAVAPAKRQTANNRRWPRDARPVKDPTTVVKPELAGRTGYRLDDRLGLKTIRRPSRQSPNFALRPAMASSNGGGSMPWMSPDACWRPPFVLFNGGGAGPRKDVDLNRRPALVLFNGGGAGPRKDVDLNRRALEAKVGRPSLEEKGAAWPLEGELA